MIEISLSRWNIMEYLNTPLFTFFILTLLSSKHYWRQKMTITPLYIYIGSRLQRVDKTSSCPRPAAAPQCMHCQAQPHHWPGLPKKRITIFAKTRIFISTFLWPTYAFLRVSKLDEYNIFFLMGPSSGHQHMMKILLFNWGSWVPSGRKVYS